MSGIKFYSNYNRISDIKLSYYRSMEFFIVIHNEEEKAL